MFKHILFNAFAVLFVINSNVSGFAFNSSSCADPTGFDSCWNKANADAVSTFKSHCTTGNCTGVDSCSTPDKTCAAITVCAAYTEWINCALNHCWNQVYGCEYQHLAIKALENCPIADQLPPYIPAPHQAPGSCSCNIGYVFSEHLAMNRPTAGELYQCTNTIASLKAAGTCQPNCDNEEKICGCCADSSATSTFFNTCPSTDPSDIYFFSSLGYNHLLSANCSSALESNANCSITPYNFTLSPGPTYDPSVHNQFFDAATIPKNGSDPLTNNPGGLATPVSGAAFTWSFYSGGVATANATVTTWTGPGATTLGSSSGSVTAVSSTTRTSTASGAVSVTTTASPKSNGWKNNPSFGLLFLSALLASVAF